MFITSKIQENSIITALQDKGEDTDLHLRWYLYDIVVSVKLELLLAQVISKEASKTGFRMHWAHLALPHYDTSWSQWEVDPQLHVSAWTCSLNVEFVEGAARRASRATRRQVCFEFRRHNIFI